MYNGDQIRLGSSHSTGIVQWKKVDATETPIRSLAISVN